MIETARANASRMQRRQREADDAAHGYQYFSHRDAILHALQDRESERVMDLTERAVRIWDVGFLVRTSSVLN